VVPTASFRLNRVEGVLKANEGVSKHAQTWSNTPKHALRFFWGKSANRPNKESSNPSGLWEMFQFVSVCFGNVSA
jgi:hypothetical protein